MMDDHGPPRVRRKPLVSCHSLAGSVAPPPYCSTAAAAPRSTLNVSSQAILVLKPRLPDCGRPYTGRKNNPGLKCVKIGNVEVSIFSSLTSDSSNVVRGAALTAGNYRGYSQTNSMFGSLFLERRY